MHYVRTNYAGGLNDLNCPLCQLEEDSPKHLMYCLKFNEESDLVAVMPKYEDLFGTEFSDKILVSRIIHQRFLRRKAILKKEDKKMPKGPSDPEVCGL